MLGSPVTLVVVTRDRVVRALFPSRSSDRPASVTVRERPESDDPVSAVVAAMNGERRRPGRVFVLSSDVWTRTLRVPTLNLRSLSTAELAQSLAFEAEPLSGLSSAEAATAVVPPAQMEDSASVWVGQLPATTLAEIDEIVRGAGGKLAGVLHPAGVPQPIDAAASAVRVEFWADATARVVHDAGRLNAFQIEQGAATANREAILGEWARQSNVDVSAVKVLIPDFRPPLDGELSFADEATLASWLTAWHRVLSARTPAAPVLRPAPRPLTTQQRRNVAAVLALAALVGCVVHGYWVGHEVKRMAAEQARLAAPGQKLSSITQQQSEAEKSLKKLRDEAEKRTADVEQAEATLAAHRTRLGELLERLSRETSKEWVLRRIDGTPREVKLVGVTMHPEHMSSLAAELAKDLADLGWAVDPPAHEARNMRDDGGPWSFELRLRDETLAAPTPKPETPAVAAPPALVRTPME